MEANKLPLFPLAKWFGKFNPKLQAFKRVLDLIFKGGESSSQFRWFTIAKLKYDFWYFLFQFWGCDCKYIQQMQKHIPRKKFLETLSFVLPAKTTVL